MIEPATITITIPDFAEHLSGPLEDLIDSCGSPRSMSDFHEEFLTELIPLVAEVLQDLAKDHNIVVTDDILCRFVVTDE